jgi:hypothetical protein
MNSSANKERMESFHLLQKWSTSIEHSQRLDLQIQCNNMDSD